MENEFQVGASGLKESFIICRNTQGIEFRATLLRLTRFGVVFEVYNPYSIVQLSEVLREFRIVMNDRLIYGGRAVVSNLMNAGIVLICEATLDDESWVDVDLFSPLQRPDRLREEFAAFIGEWEKVHKVLPEFKVVVADLQTLLTDLRRWLEQVELSIRSESRRSRPDLEREVINELQEPMLPKVEELFIRFESVAGGIGGELQPVHRTYVKRQLHPLLLCSPFMYRIYEKPLGYAGDYEMVNMILRDPHEGSSLFAKILNVYILSQAPAAAHRNRVTYLTERISTETRRVARLGRTARVLNLGCGPAKEIQDFLVQDDLCDRAQLTLLDFNDETLAFTLGVLEEIKAKSRRFTKIEVVKKSVHQILKELPRRGEGQVYDLIYCAGLFDYLSDRICKKLLELFYEQLAPGGLLIATNVDASNPIRNVMELVFEWHLVYRDEKKFLALGPEKAPPESMTVKSDTTGSNIFLEIRKAAQA